MLGALGLDKGSWIWMHSNSFDSMGMLSRSRSKDPFVFTGPFNSSLLFDGFLFLRLRSQKFTANLSVDNFNT